MQVLWRILAADHAAAAGRADLTPGVRPSSAGRERDARALSERPLCMMTLAVTGECNLRCRYCYQNAKSGARMPWAVLKAAADSVLASTSPRVDVVFAGGEPMLAFDLIERAVAYIERRRPAGLGVQYSLATNGTLLGPDAIAFLDRHRFDIELSFDGVLPAQAVRGECSFARIDGALDDLRDKAPQTFRRRVTVGVTLDAAAVPYLSASFSYFLGKQLRAISISPAAGQAGRWTPEVIRRPAAEEAGGVRGRAAGPRHDRRRWRSLRLPDARRV